MRLRLPVSEIGADGYSDNANSAVTVAKQLLGKL